MKEIIFNVRKMFRLGKFDVIMRSTLIDSILDEESKAGEHGWLHAPHPEGLMASPCFLPRPEGLVISPCLLPHLEGLVVSPCLLPHPEGPMVSLLDEESRVGGHGWLHAPHPEGLMVSPYLLCSPPWTDGGHTRT